MTTHFRTRTVQKILRIWTHHQQEIIARSHSTKPTCEKQLSEKSCKQDVCSSVRPEKKGFFGGLFGSKAKSNKAAEKLKPQREQCKIEQGMCVTHTHTPLTPSQRAQIPPDTPQTFT